MHEDLLGEFRKHYVGRHRPEDALWWLDHPDAPGPSSAAPPQQLLLVAADELERNGDHESAAALLNLTAEVLAADRRAARDALDRVAETLNHEPPRARRRDQDPAE